MDRIDRIARIIREFDSQGWHRTGTPVDHESARWLADKAREIGVAAELEPFGLSRVDPRECWLEVGGNRIPGLPMFDGEFTSSGGVRGRIGPLGSDAEIGLGRVTRGGSENRVLDDARKSGGCQGLVAVTAGDRPGLMPMNATAFPKSFGPPVLQVARETEERLIEYARLGMEATLMVSVERTESESFNVVGRIEGAEQGLAPLIVMTPRSGWWQCASERGGGIACWLALMQAIMEAGARRDVIFVATSAHELGLLGVHDFMRRRPGVETGAFAWLHFGANIGGALDPSARFSATDQLLETMIAEALEQHNANPAEAVPRGTTVGAESQVIAGLGGRVTAMVGGNPLFHLESDRWPDAVDVDSVAGFAAAYSDVAIELAQSKGWAGLDGG